MKARSLLEALQSAIDNGDISGDEDVMLLGSNGHARPLHEHDDSKRNIIGNFGNDELRAGDFVLATTDAD